MVLENLLKVQITTSSPDRIIFILKRLDNIKIKFLMNHRYMWVKSTNICKTNVYKILSI
jgi:hypothetical protein